MLGFVAGPPERWVKTLSLPQPSPPSPPLSPTASPLKPPPRVFGWRGLAIGITTWVGGILYLEYATAEQDLQYLEQWLNIYGDDLDLDAALQTVWLSAQKKARTESPEPSSSFRPRAASLSRTQVAALHRTLSKPLDEQIRALEEKILTIQNDLNTTLTLTSFERKNQESALQKLTENLERKRCLKSALDHFKQRITELKSTLSSMPVSQAIYQLRDTRLSFDLILNNPDLVGTNPVVIAILQEILRRQYDSNLRWLDVQLHEMKEREKSQPKRVAKTKSVEPKPNSAPSPTTTASTHHPSERLAHYMEETSRFGRPSTTPPEILSPEALAEEIERCEDAIMTYGSIICENRNGESYFIINHRSIRREGIGVLSEEETASLRSHHAQRASFDARLKILQTQQKENETDRGRLRLLDRELEKMTNEEAMTRLHQEITTETATGAPPGKKSYAAQLPGRLRLFEYLQTISKYTLPTLSHENEQNQCRTAIATFGWMVIDNRGSGNYYKITFSDNKQIWFGNLSEPLIKRLTTHYQKVEQFRARLKELETKK